VRTIAALYVQQGGAYFGLEGVDPWPESRDARLYDGPHPVVAHPPCSRWCQLAHVNQARYGHRVGDDGGCFEAALASVRKWGGVLEHPAYSYAWPHFGLLPPTRGRWTRELFDPGWVCEVNQSAYGHLARKRTWLYYVGDGPPPELDWRDEPGSHWCGNDGSKPGDPGWKPSLGKKAASASPVEFRDLLISIARSAR
jgi:hypothetical protein